MPLTICEVNFIWKLSANCVIVSDNVVNQGVTFAITETKIYVLVVTLSTKDNTKLLTQLESGIKRIINWKKYLSKPELFVQNSNLSHLAKPSFQGVNTILDLKMIQKKQEMKDIFS